MSNLAIKVENLSKKYTISHERERGDDNFREAIIGTTKKIITSLNPFSQTSARKDTTKEEFLALDNISFEVNQGDKVGIIGRNGAGKSTLLKVLSRITEPTSGKIHINGRIASLLEVGTGFHPELTGRENIYLNGAILGMSRAEIKKKFDEIVAFAEVEKFLDTPVKRYSSGMYVRLAFAVAAHLEPEILVVDEVLAVGDVEFQKKCLGKMSEVSKKGRTILFVSHNMNAIRQLCNHGILLHEGCIVDYNDANSVCDRYLQLNHHSLGTYNIQKQLQNLQDDKVFRLLDVKTSQPVEFVENGVPLKIFIKFLVKEDVIGLRVYIELKDTDGNLILRSFHDEDCKGTPFMKKDAYESCITIPQGFLAPREYVISVHSGIYNNRYTLPVEGIKIPINVIHTSRYNYSYPGDKIAGQLAVIMDWTTHKIKDNNEKTNI
jgi:lipopolysaccharide transport system ATP-binding protein